MSAGPDDDVVYYNLTIGSASTKTSGDPHSVAEVLASAAVNSNIPIINNPEEYHCSIVRMAFTGYTIPLIQFCVQTPVTDINLGVYSFTLSYGGTDSAQTFYRFKPQLQNVTPPPTGTPTQTFGPYYFGFDYEWIVDIMNTAIAAAMADLKTKVGGAIAAAKDPFFFYDETMGRITLYADANFFDESLATPIKIYFNNASYVYMVGFYYNNISSDDPIGKDSLLVIRSVNGLNTKTISAVNYISMPQQYVTLEYMSSLKSILITTSMNIRPESFNVSNGGAIQNISYTNVMQDYLPDISQPTPGISSYKFIYNAVFPYRIFNFYQKTPLYTIDAAVKFTDQFGNIYDFYNQKGQSVDLKFMFIKKSSYSPSKAIKDYGRGTELWGRA